MKKIYRTYELKLFAKDLNNPRRKHSEVITIARDGWVITRDGSFGDNGEDCELYIKMDIKKLRIDAGISQQEMGWIMGKSRTCYLYAEKHGGKLFLRDYLCLTLVKELYNFLPKPLINLTYQ